MRLIEKLGYIYNGNKTKDSWGLFKCDCGNEIVTTQRGGIARSLSCGCKTSFLLGEVHVTHGSHKTSLYKVWSGMKSRCFNKNNLAYKNYGGRGIYVCNEWLEFTPFKTWALKKGYMKGLEIDRKNNDIGYKPSNCHWVTHSINNINTRTIRANNTSGYKGVSFNKLKSSWVSNVTINKHTHQLGYFETKEKAVVARNNYIVKNNLPHEIQKVLK